MQRLFVFAFLAGLVVACGGDREPGSTGGGGSAGVSGGGASGSAGAGGSSGQGGAGRGAAGRAGGVGPGGSSGSPDGGGAGQPVDGGIGLPDGATGADAGSVGCSVGGVSGECLDVSACGDMPGYSSTPGFCPGPAEIQCCTRTPSVSDNPPVPAGWRLMMQSEVTPEMTAWAIAILRDRVTYPMFSTTTMVFGTLTVMARVEWHPPDFNNGSVHRGVTLYKPL